MTTGRSKLVRIIDRLEQAYGQQNSAEPDDAYELVLHRNCGYPPSDSNCARGFAALAERVGLAPGDILAASEAALRSALRAGGIVPELRARRLREIATRVRDEFGGDLGRVLEGPLPRARKALTSFPTIADAGADKVLLFTGTAPVAALPSNCVHVPVRLGFGRDSKTWSAKYRSAQEVIHEELPEDFGVRRRAYLLLKRHGQEVCKASRPRCDRCVVSADCEYFRKLGRQ